MRQSKMHEIFYHLDTWTQRGAFFGLNGVPHAHKQKKVSEMEKHFSQKIDIRLNLTPSSRLEAKRRRNYHHFRNTQNKNNQKIYTEIHTEMHNHKKIKAVHFFRINKKIGYVPSQRDLTHTRCGVKKKRYSH
eukprot:GEMP01076533.1.p1 GENE.GEMP01076533.1~~GEMP01076533.1.p1  ORF type:complete len:132 (-),score=5.32 GEMP01076533.1:646-1041(-)